MWMSCTTTINCNFIPTQSSICWKPHLWFGMDSKRTFTIFIIVSCVVRIHLLLQWSFTCERKSWMWVWFVIENVASLLVNCVSIPLDAMFMNAEVELSGYLNGCGGVDMFAMALIICEHRTLFAPNCISWVLMTSIYINFFLWFDKFHFPVTLWVVTVCSWHLSLCLNHSQFSSLKCVTSKCGFDRQASWEMKKKRVELLNS